MCWWVAPGFGCGICCVVLLLWIDLVPRGASAATAYHKLFRGAVHLVPSYPAPPAECEAGSEDRPSSSLSNDRPQTGKYGLPGWTWNRLPGDVQKLDVIYGR